MEKYWLQKSEDLFLTPLYHTSICTRWSWARRPSTSDGADDGLLEGLSDGLEVGTSEGIDDGVDYGRSDGAREGNNDGISDGKEDVSTAE